MKPPNTLEALEILRHYESHNDEEIKWALEILRVQAHIEDVGVILHYADITGSQVALEIVTQLVTGITQMDHPETIADILVSSQVLEDDTLVLLIQMLLALDDERILGAMSLNKQWLLVHRPQLIDAIALIPDMVQPG